MGGDAVEVVLDEEDDGQVVERGHVEGFVGRAVLHRAVAEEGDGEVAALPQLLGQRVAHRLRRVAADDGVGAEHAGLVPTHVHRAAAPAAVAGREPHDLGHGAVHDLLHRLGPLVGARVVVRRRRVVQELGEELVMGAVGGVDLVGVRQRRHGADRAALLADARVRGPVHAARLEEFENPLLEAADEQELLQEIGQDLRVLAPASRPRPALETMPRSLGDQRFHRRHGALPCPQPARSAGPPPFIAERPARPGDGRPRLHAEIVTADRPDHSGIILDRIM